jgi:hypothetical protein
MFFGDCNSNSVAEKQLLQRCGLSSRIRQVVHEGYRSTRETQGLPLLDKTQLQPRLQGLFCLDETSSEGCLSYQDLVVVSGSMKFLDTWQQHQRQLELRDFSWLVRICYSMMGQVICLC